MKRRSVIPASTPFGRLTLVAFGLLVLLASLGLVGLEDRQLLLRDDHFGGLGVEELTVDLGAVAELRGPDLRQVRQPEKCERDAGLILVDVLLGRGAAELDRALVRYLGRLRLQQAVAGVP